MYLIRRHTAAEKDIRWARYIPLVITISWTVLVLRALAIPLLVWEMMVAIGRGKGTLLNAFMIAILLVAIIDELLKAVFLSGVRLHVAVRLGLMIKSLWEEI